jgi:hypothetical protein
VSEVCGQILAGVLVRVLAAQPVPVGVRTGQCAHEQILRGRGGAEGLTGEQRGGMQQSACRARDERLELPGPAAFFPRTPLSHVCASRYRQ